MRRIILGLLVIPLVTVADPGRVELPRMGNRQEAIQTSRQLSSTIDRVESQSRQLAEQAYRNGNYNRADKLSDLAFEAGALGRELTRLVVRPLAANQPLRRIAQELDSMQPDFRRLQQTANQILLKPAALARDVDRVRQLVGDLDRLLQAGDRPNPIPGPGPRPIPGPGPHPIPGPGPRPIPGPGPHPIPGPGPRPIPGPGPIGQFKCTAGDTGWEEHIFRPHVGYGATLLIAQQAAIQACQREHGRCSVTGCERM